MGNKPRIRFKGFTEDWEQRKLGDIATFSKGNGYSKSDLTPSGDPIILYGRLYTNYETTISNVDTFVELKDKSVISQGGEVIVPASGETAEDISRASVVKNQGIIIGGDLNVIKVNHLLDPTFLALTISNGEQQKELSKRAQGKSVVHLHNSDLQEVNLTFPLLNEQKEISTLFEKMDSIITLHQCKLEKLKLTKKALLQKLFPKNGKHIPEIRFKGFTDAWEQREFSDIFAEIKSGLSRMLSNDDIGVPVVRANNINDGQLNLVDDIKYWYKNDPQGANTNNYLIEQGDILINFINSEAKMGTAAYVTRRPERDTIYTTNILRCKVNDEYNPYFIYSLTFLNSYKNYIASITKPAVNQASFTTVDFKKYSIKIPTIKEQNQIADLIEIFNKFITLHQRKLERLQEVKKGLLQKMFV